MPWWLWVLIGFLLFGVEALSPGLHIAFFGFGALAVGGLVAFDLAGPLWVQLLLFSVISLASLLLLRQPLLRRFRLVRSNEPMDTLVGESAIPSEEITSGSIGKAELRGTSWSARNGSARTLSRGERCVVDRVEGLTVVIRPVGEG